MRSRRAQELGGTIATLDRGVEIESWLLITAETTKDSIFSLASLDVE